MTSAHLATFVTLALGAALGCGGTQGEGRPEAGPVPRAMVDPGSGPFACSADDDLELSILDDFELGAALGNWYSNNDVCSPCQEVQNEIDALDAHIERLEGIGVEIAAAESALEVARSAPDPEPSEIDRLEEALSGLEEERERLEATYSVQEARKRQNDLRDGRVTVDANTPYSIDPQKGVITFAQSLDKCLLHCADAQNPGFAEKPIPADVIPKGGRCGSRYALHMVAGHPSLGVGPLIDWGGVIGYPFSMPFDATDYDGISFWGRIGAQSRETYRVQVSDKNTDDVYAGEDGNFTSTGRPLPEGELGPICNPRTSPDDSTTGCDKFGAYVLADTDWQFFKIPFDEMRQAGWGRPAGSLDLEGLYSLVFAYEVGSWDLWIDDVALYRSP